VVVETETNIYEVMNTYKAWNKIATRNIFKRNNALRLARLWQTPLSNAIADATVYLRIYSQVQYSTIQRGIGGAM
jgi:hypothetical protein